MDARPHQVVIPSAARNLLFGSEKADSSLASLVRNDKTGENSYLWDRF